MSGSPTLALPPAAPQGEVIPVLDESRHKLRRALFLTGALLLLAGAFADIQGVALSPLIGTVSADLKLTGGQVGWIINGLTLSGAMAAGLLSRLADLVGHRRVLIPILAAGAIGSVICAVSTSFAMLLVGRTLIGVGVPAVAIIWGLIRPRATEGQVRTLSLTLGSVIGLGVAVSLVLGGVLLELGAGWQSVFWLLTAGYTIMLGLAIASPESPESVRDRVPIDWLGGIGLGAWLVALLLGITWGQDYGWSNARTVFTLAVALVCGVAWIVQQKRNPYRLMAFDRSDVRQMLSGYLGQWAVVTCGVTVYTFVPLILQAPPESGYGFGLTVLQSSLPLLMLVPASVLAQQATTRVIPLVGPRTVMVAAGCVGITGIVGMALAHQHVWQLYVWVFIYALGLISAYNTGWALTAASGRQDNISIAMGMQYAGTNVISSIATAIILGMLVPNAAGFFDESILTKGFLGTAAVVAAFTIAWALLVPRTLIDRHAAIRAGAN